MTHDIDDEHERDRRGVRVPQDDAQQTSERSHEHLGQEQDPESRPRNDLTGPVYEASADLNEHVVDRGVDQSGGSGGNHHIGEVGAAPTGQLVDEEGQDSAGGEGAQDQLPEVERPTWGVTSMAVGVPPGFSPPEPPS